MLNHILPVDNASLPDTDSRTRTYHFLKQYQQLGFNDFYFVELYLVMFLGESLYLYTIVPYISEYICLNVTNTCTCILPVGFLKCMLIECVLGLSIWLPYRSEIDVLYFAEGKEYDVEKFEREVTKNYFEKQNTAAVVEEVQDILRKAMEHNIKNGTLTNFKDTLNTFLFTEVYNNNFSSN